MVKNNIFCPELKQLSDISDQVLYTALNASCCMVSGAGFVDSYEEILGISDEFNTTYNRFSLFTLFAGDSFTQLEFSVYINRNLKEFYLRFDDIPYKNFRLEGKPLPLSSCRIRFSHADEDISRYADETLLPDLTSYYKGSWADGDGFELYFMDGDADISAIIAFGNGVKNIRYISTLFDCLGNDLILRSITEEKVSSPFTLPRYICYAESLDGKYRYIRDHRFLWHHNSSSKYLLETPDNRFFVRLER